MTRRHPNVVNISEVEPRVQEHGGKFGFSGRRLGPEVGSESIGTSYFEIEPGRQAFPHHYHTANEEAVFVIERLHVRPCSLGADDHQRAGIGRLL